MGLILNIISLYFLFCTISASLIRDGGGSDTNDLFQLGAKKSQLSNSQIHTMPNRSESISTSPEGSVSMSRSRLARGAHYTYDFVRWPNAIIPYTIEEDYNFEQRNMIIKAMRTIQQYTCVRFVPRSNERDYILVKNLSHAGCWSLIGNSGGRQPLLLEAPHSFLKIGTTLHELLHAIGLIDEHDRPDRDDHVTVLTENIMEDDLRFFDKVRKSGTDTSRLPYDYYSVMHYSEYTSSKNGLKTIEPKDRNVTTGQREGLTRGDVTAINYMYGCDEPVITLTRTRSNKSSRILPNFGEYYAPEEMISTTPSPSSDDWQFSPIMAKYLAVRPQIQFTNRFMSS